MELGATGKFPRGKITENDEGELKIAIGVKDNTIIVDFGKQVCWLGLDKQSALELANILIKHANSMKEE